MTPGLAADNPVDILSANWSTLETYCMECHNFIDYSGGIDFTLFNPRETAEHAEIFERALSKLRAYVMPPPSQPQPSEEERWALIRSIESVLDEHAALNTGPGSISLHRLNRTEYINAIYELTGVGLAADVLPQDDISDGFDNIANVLKVSPAFLDQFITAARLVSEIAIGDPDPIPETSVYPMDTADQTSHVHGLPLGTRGGVLVEHIFPVDGEYAFNIEGLVTGSYLFGMEHDSTLIITLDGEEVFRRTIGGSEDLRFLDQLQAPAIDEVNARFSNIRLAVSSGRHQVGMSFIARSFVESDEILHHPGENIGLSRLPKASRLTITGPFNANGVINTPSRQKVMICEPQSLAEELDCARQIFTRLATLAFRRPLENADLEAPMQFYAQAREQGSFDAGIKNGMVAILASPKFLYRTELPPAGSQPGEVYTISDHALASRLSFFLWSSPPDTELITLASRQELSDPEILDAQIDRMLADSRASALVDNFVFQWLGLRGLYEVNPDTEIFPRYDSGLRDDLIEELQRFISSVLIEDRSIIELLDADYTFANERLGLHYGLADIRGDQFRRVQLENEERHGLLGKGGLLMLTSYANRTSPVVRGAYIMEKLMGVEPASPPPNVEAFPETPEGSAVSLTVRERLESHRANPTCAGCHDVMDPLGLALENFDAIGAWRDRDSDAGNVLIDASGSLASGQAINGVNDLREALLRNPEQFVQIFTRNLLTYALGRTVEFHDMPAVREIVRTVANEDYRFSSIVRGVINSDQFLMSAVPDPELSVAEQ